MVAGVAAGLGEYFGLDVILVRLIFVIAACLGGTGIIVYVAGWLLMPDEGEKSSILENLINKSRT
jgi:phage shock protein PspC (stress-responsive transcriptional regulator)